MEDNNISYITRKILASSPNESDNIANLIIIAEHTITSKNSINKRKSQHSIN